MAKFTYTEKETKFITNLFKNTKVKIAFITNNKIERILSTQYSSNQKKYDNAEFCS
jgi:hypothetical protein